MFFQKKKSPKSLSFQFLFVPLQPQISKVVFAQMAESVDALVSNTSGAIHPGSIPGLGTRSCKFLLAALPFANTIAQMAESVDALVSKPVGATHPVPPGVWFTGPIVLKSNINLHLEKGAVILFSPDDALYPFIETSFEGLDTRRCQSPISGHHLTNVAITGQGALTETENTGAH